MDAAAPRRDATEVQDQLLAEAEAAAPAEAAKEDGHASVAASTVNLVKSIVGAGVLALPAGVAAFSDAGTAWPADGADRPMTGVPRRRTPSACSAGCAAPTTPRRTRTHSRASAEKSAWVVTLCCGSTPFLACLAYSIIMGDAAASLRGGDHTRGPKSALR